MNNFPSQPYDLIVFGATSFVGRILCRHLWMRQMEGLDFRWAVVGRSRQRLEELQEELGLGKEALPVHVVDAHDAEAMTAMVRATRVVVSTVGPYALYGSGLVALCAREGRDYLDLSGEVPWIARMLAYEPLAKQSGARIVHCCGFDSIPSDLGVQYLQEQSKDLWQEYCVRVRMMVARIEGGFSGGTVASMLNVAREAWEQPELRRLLANPYALCPNPVGPRQPNAALVEKDNYTGQWTAPFVMSAINTRVVLRSHALQGNCWADNFLYDEVMLTGEGWAALAKATAIRAALVSFFTASALAPTRKLLERYVVPKPGEGPSAQEQEDGGYLLWLRGHTASGRSIWVSVQGDRDPGYGSTGKMLGEAALCMAFDRPHEQLPGGFWTPSTAMGPLLRQRLQKHAGIQFTRMEAPAH